MRPPRILVLTLHSGEREFDANRASVARQVGVVAEQDVLSGLGNVEAHRQLYERIMRSAGDFDLFLKLDADMVLRRPGALSEVASIFAGDPEIDHLTARVTDHFTGKDIFGVHAFSPRVRWETGRHDRLFVDPGPQYPGRHLVAPEDLAIFVDHAPDPGDFQAFHFGYHRALKAIQPGRLKRYSDAMVIQLQILRDVAAHRAATGRRTLGLAVIAAGMVLSGRLSGITGDKGGGRLEAAFREVSALDDGEIARRAEATSFDTARLRFARALAMARLAWHGRGWKRRA